MAYTTIDNPELYFQVKLYTGDGSTPSITLDGDTDMQPDFVWIKNRDQTDSHCLFDSARGATKHMSSDATDEESTDADTLTSFDSDGFALGADVKVNTDTEAYVAWNWKESATAGFDIVLYTGTGSTATPSHSLSAVPHVMIVKRRNTSEGWQVYHHKQASDPEDYALELNTTLVTGDHANRWNDTAPTSSVFTVEDHGTVNAADDTYVNYLFTGKQGFSKFGSYIGNGDDYGPFVYTGFRPAYVMEKRANDSGSWTIQDNKRSTFNVTAANFLAESANAEYTGTGNRIDILSNGFKCRKNDTDNNGSGDTIIYMAFAEAPFVNSNGVPCNAR